MKKLPFLISAKAFESRSFSDRLAAYSTAAGAALLAAPGAHAAIQNITSFVSSGTIPPPSLANGQNQVFSVGGFRLSASGVPVSYGHPFYLAGRGTVSAPVEIKGVNGGGGFAARLAYQQTITGGAFSKYNSHVADSHQAGQFNPVANGTKTGYVAFERGTGSAKYYGFLRIKVTANGSANPTHLSFLALKNDPGVYGAFDLASDVVVDGFKAGVIAAVPEPSTAVLGGLGLLALGASGVRELRRRRATAA